MYGANLTLFATEESAVCSRNSLLSRIFQSCTLSICARAATWKPSTTPLF